MYRPLRMLLSCSEGNDFLYCLRKIDIKKMIFQITFKLIFQILFYIKKKHYKKIYKEEERTYQKKKKPIVLLK